MSNDTGMFTVTLNAKDKLSHSLLVSSQHQYYPSLHLVEHLEF